MNDKELLAHLNKQMAYHRGAWAKVIDSARAYQQMKQFGTYENAHGHQVTVALDEQEMHVDVMQKTLMRNVAEAYIEDARMGATISKVAGGPK